LQLEGFEISHTKDGFRWDENEDVLLELLKDELDKEPLPLLDQAEGHRVRPKASDWKKGAETAVQTTAEVIEQEVPPSLKGNSQKAQKKKSLPKISEKQPLYHVELLT